MTTRNYVIQMGAGLNDEKNLKMIAVSSATVAIDVDNLIDTVDTMKKLTDIATELLYAIRINQKSHADELKQLLTNGVDGVEEDILMRLRDKINSTSVKLEHVTRVEGENGETVIVIKYIEPKEPNHPQNRTVGSSIPGIS